MYQTAYQKAASIMESIIINPPFVEGNKRTGFLAMFSILTKEKIKLKANYEKIYTFTIRDSTGESKFEDIVEWLKQNPNPL